jgi:hypothetical protein
VHEARRALVALVERAGRVDAIAVREEPEPYAARILAAAADAVRVM